MSADRKTEHNYVAETTSWAGSELPVLHGGEGPSLLLLHRDTGEVGWTALHDGLGAHYEVFAPIIPGFDGISLPRWVRCVRDLTCVLQRFVDGLGLASPRLVGLGFGGWIAAELLSARPTEYSALVLHAPMGLKPESGHYLDQFLMEPEDYVRLGFSCDDAFQSCYPEVSEETKDIWLAHRESAAQVAWRPYMYDASLPYRLAEVSVPTQVLASSSDRIVPAACSRQFAKLLDAGDVQAVTGGHLAELESPSALATAIHSALAAMSQRIDNERRS